MQRSFGQNCLPYDGKFYDRQVTGSHATARVILRELFGLGLTQIESVVDVGCGLGTWLAAALALGATQVVGLDGEHVDHFRLLVEPSCFRPCNLERVNVCHSVSDSPRFDLAICLEVAEHLSSLRASSFVAELCSLSDLILFSAAIPGQGGTAHINEQWPEYWSGLFAKGGFGCFDILRPMLWQCDDCAWWYLQNALIFARQNSLPFKKAAALAPMTAAPMRLVHPKNLEQKVAELNNYKRRVEAEIAVAHYQNDVLRREIVAIHRSTSWLVSAPLRWVSRAISHVGRS